MSEHGQSPNGSSRLIARLEGMTVGCPARRFESKTVEPGSGCGHSVDGRNCPNSLKAGDVGVFSVYQYSGPYVAETRCEQHADELDVSPDSNGVLVRARVVERGEGTIDKTRPNQPRAGDLPPDDPRHLELVDVEVVP